MSEENVEIVRRASEAALRRPPDWETVNRLYDPKHELVSLERELEGGAPWKGAKGFQGWREQMDEAGEWDGEVVSLREAPDGRVVVTGEFRLRGARSGLSIAQRSTSVVTVRNGQIVRTEVFRSPAEALAAAGLSE
jgi:ketosteroid isomerase-like protein